MENLGKIELKRILTCMKDYEYDDIYDLEPGEYDGSYTLKLKKRVDFSSDETITVTIDFSTVFDDKTTYIKDDYENLVYNNENAAKARKFINKLMKDDLTTRGGQKKGTRKHKRKIKK
jgi:hypothetical protein